MVIVGDDVVVAAVVVTGGDDDDATTDIVGALVDDNGEMAALRLFGELIAAALIVNESFVAASNRLE